MLLRSVVSCATVRPRYSVSTAAPELRNLSAISAMAAAFSGLATGPPSEMKRRRRLPLTKGAPAQARGSRHTQEGLPVTYDPALVARMLRNLRSSSKGQDDNRRSLVGLQRTCRSTTVKIGACTRSQPSHRRKPGTKERGRTDDPVRPRGTGEGSDHQRTRPTLPRPEGSSCGSDPAEYRGPWSWTSLLSR